MLASEFRSQQSRELVLLPLTLEALIPNVSAGVTPWALLQPVPPGADAPGLHLSYCKNCLPRLPGDPLRPSTRRHSLPDTLQWPGVALQIESNARPRVYCVPCARKFISGCSRAHFPLGTHRNASASSISLNRLCSWPMIFLPGTFFFWCVPLLPRVSPEAPSAQGDCL